MTLKPEDLRPRTFDVFSVGARYRVLKTFVRGTAFVLGESLLFEDWGYSWYDGAYLYYFKRLDEGGVASWMLYPRESPKSWTDYFELVAEDPSAKTRKPEDPSHEE